MMIVVKQMLRRRAQIEKELEAIDFVLDALEKYQDTTVESPKPESKIKRVREYKPRTEEQKKQQSDKMKANWAKKHSAERVEDQEAIQTSNAQWLNRIEGK